MCSEDLRYTVVDQEFRIKSLEEELARVREGRKKCERQRRREGAFLEAVVTQCRGDNVPLSDLRCGEFCTRYKVRTPVCRALCETRAPPCSYWHQDTATDFRITQKEHNEDHQ